MILTTMIVFTNDEFRGYKQLTNMGYNHNVIKHYKGEFVKGNTHTNSIEGF